VINTTYTARVKVGFSTPDGWREITHEFFRYCAIKFNGTYPYPTSSLFGSRHFTDELNMRNVNAALYSPLNYPCK
jgi:hypothetical protein